MVNSNRGTGLVKTDIGTNKVGVQILTRATQKLTLVSGSFTCNGNSNRYNLLTIKINLLILHKMFQSTKITQITQFPKKLE